MSEQKGYIIMDQDHIMILIFILKDADRKKKKKKLRNVRKPEQETKDLGCSAYD